MASAFEKLWTLGPAAIVLKAIVGAIVADCGLLGFILLRRTYRKRHFRRRDRRVYEFRQNWDAVITGKIPYDTWRKRAFDRRIVEEIVLDAFEAAGPDEAAQLLKFVRVTGLIEKRIFEARHHRGWRRLRALVALGRTRAPEGIPALAEALRDANPEIRRAALRGLSRMGSPEAGREILAWLSETGLKVSPLPLQNALINCCRERPEMLLPYLKYAEPRVKEVLARVFGEIASESLEADVLALASDELPELRAAAARALAHAGRRELALDALGELAHDPVWFVRLRAVVALGQISDRGTTPLLLQAVRDSNRLVRMRAAEALAGQKDETASVFAGVVATQDRYALHAYLAAVETAGLRQNLEAELCQREQSGDSDVAPLLAALRTGHSPLDQSPGRLPGRPVTVSLP